MAKKPAPSLQSSFKGLTSFHPILEFQTVLGIEHDVSEREQFQLGTLSHALNQRCTRYQDLPNFPQVRSAECCANNSSHTMKTFSGFI